MTPLVATSSVEILANCWSRNVWTHFPTLFEILKLNIEMFQILLKGTTKLYFAILWIVRVWSLYCSMRIYKSLHFLPILLKKLLHFGAFYIFGLFCVGFDVIFINFITLVEPLLQKISIVVVRRGCKCASALKKRRSVLQSSIFVNCLFFRAILS